LLLANLSILERFSNCSIPKHTGVINGCAELTEISVYIYLEFLDACSWTTEIYKKKVFLNCIIFFRNPNASNN